jgi:signal transduction histidine kinase
MQPPSLDAIDSGFSGRPAQLETSRVRSVELVRRADSAAQSDWDPCTQRMKRITRDLHDNVAGELSLAIRQLELSEAHRRTDPELAGRKAARAREVLGDLMTTVRLALADLRESPALAESGDDLGAALNAFAAGLEDTRTSMRVEVIGDEGRVPAFVRCQVLLVVRECLLNSANHAGASKVTATIEITAASIVARVDDDGRGFDPVRLTVAGRGHGFGLASVRERVEALGGFLRIATRPGAGTRIRARIPLAPDASV